MAGRRAHGSLGSPLCAMLRSTLLANHTACGPQVGSRHEYAPWHLQRWRAGRIPTALDVVVTKDERLRKVRSPRVFSQRVDAGICVGLLVLLLQPTTAVEDAVPNVLDARVGCRVFLGTS